MRVTIGRFLHRGVRSVEHKVGMRWGEEKIRLGCGGWVGVTLFVFERSPWHYLLGWVTNVSVSQN